MRALAALVAGSVLAAALTLAPGAGAAVPHLDLSYDRGTPPAIPAQNALDLYLPEGTRAGDRLPLVAYVHGGGWRAGDKRNKIADKVAAFTGAGYAFASLNYRLSPAAGDPATAPGRVRFPAHPDDVGEALGWLDRHAAGYGADPRRIVLVGHSAGAHLVSLVGTDRRYASRHGLEPWQIAAVVSLDTDAFDIAAEAASGATNPELFWNAFATPAENAADGSWSRGSPIRWADRGDPPLLLVTSLNPRRRADNEAMASALGQDPAGVLALPYSHQRINEALGAADDTAGETAAVMSFIRRELNRARPVGVRLRDRPPRRLRTDGARSRVRFRFAAPRAESFECRIDRGRWRRCRSPQRYRLARGRHLFEVRALTERGRPGSVKRWRFRIRPER